MSQKLLNKVAIITGASAYALANEGAHLVITARRVFKPRQGRPQGGIAQSNMRDPEDIA